MFKYLAGILNPSKGSLSLIKSYRATDINKIRLYQGPIFGLGGTVDAIAFFMPPDLVWEGGLNKSILLAAGPEIDGYVLANVTSPKPGEVFPLPGFKTPFSALFLGILNAWDGGVDFEDRDLLDCYRDTIKLAVAQGITRIAFPAMGRDRRDFPHIKFARLAIEGIEQGLARAPSIETITIACADGRMAETYRARLQRRGWKN